MFHIKLKVLFIFRMEPDSFSDLINLERLFISKNDISAVTKNMFHDLPNLEQLYLDDNLIKEIDENAFHDLVSLKELSFFLVFIFIL